MPTLKEFIKSSKSENIAGYLDELYSFHYLESSNKALPAAVHVVTKLGDRSKDKVYTNLAKGHWLMTYLGKQVKDLGYLDHSDKDVQQVVGHDITPVDLVTLPLPMCPAGPKIAPPLEGGLYAAAKAVEAGPTGKLVGQSKGLERALRYYMLAAYSLLYLCKLESYQGIGNYVAALLVSDRGEILSVGINTGSFRHAEVNMLLNYFAKSAAIASTFDENTIVFSTLTPCEQCTKYLKATRPAKSVIYFGQMDTGPKGSAGTAISSAISDKTKPLQGVTDKKDPSLEKLEGVVVDSGGVLKLQIDKGLANCVSGPNIAAQIGESAAADALLQSAIKALEHKVAKTRHSGKADKTDEDDVKQKVLLYLAEWLISIKLA